MGLVWEHKIVVFTIYFKVGKFTGPRRYRGTGLLHWIASALKTSKVFKHRNAVYKNEAIIRLSSHHTMQRKPEDRVLPYNGQNMIDTNKTKAFDIITSVYMFQKQFQS